MARSLVREILLLKRESEVFEGESVVQPPCGAYDPLFPLNREEPTGNPQRTQVLRHSQELGLGGRGWTERSEGSPGVSG